MKKCYLITDEACILHNMGINHPEQPDRLRYLLEALDKDEFNDLVKVKPIEATIEILELAHNPLHIKNIFDNAPINNDIIAIDPDTSLNKHSLKATLLAVGAGIMAVDKVMNSDIKHAFCATRPPGHHATANKSIGFCIFNNIAIAVAYAIDKYNLKKIAIVDFDVHHGNGTQDIFYNNKNVLYSSSHQMPLYPGSGYEYETGKYNNIVNAPLATGSASMEFREAYNNVILPRIDEFAPELIFISAGFDAHKDDHLAGLNLIDDDYNWVTKKLVELANKHSNDRIVSLLEGGYNLQALSSACSLHIKQLM